MSRRGRSWPALVAALVALSACRDQVTSGSGIRAELRAAIDNTLAAKSLHIEVSQWSPDESRRPSSIDYNAPDRIRSVSGSGGDSIEEIAIGNAVFFNDPARPGHFFSSEQPGPPQAQTVLAFLHPIREAPEVRVDDGDHVARLGDESGTTVRIRVDKGYVVRVLQPGAGEDAADVVYELSRFGTAAQVVAPPPERVTQAPTVPECPDDGAPPQGVLACTGGSAVEPREIELPKVSEPVETKLQFRLVRAEAASDCTAPAANPPGSEPIVMPDPGRRCLDLAEAALEVERVESLTATTNDGSAVSLDITLLPADARRFDAVIERHLGERLALVVFGRVVTASTIEGTGSGGRLHISGLSTNDAARVNAALSR